MADPADLCTDDESVNPDTDESELPVSVALASRDPPVHQHSSAQELNRLRQPELSLLPGPPPPFDRQFPLARQVSRGCQHLLHPQIPFVTPLSTQDPDSHKYVGLLDLHDRAKEQWDGPTYGTIIMSSQRRYLDAFPIEMLQKEESHPASSRDQVIPLAQKGNLQEVSRRPEKVPLLVWKKWSNPSQSEMIFPADVTLAHEDVSLVYFLPSKRRPDIAHDRASVSVD